MLRAAFSTQDGGREAGPALHAIQTAQAYSQPPNRPPVGLRPLSMPVFRLLRLPLSLILFPPLLILLRISYLPLPSDRCAAHLSLSHPSHDYRFPPTNNQTHLTPNYVTKGPNRVICKAYNFNSLVPAPMTLIGSLNTLAVKLIGLITPLPIPGTIAVDFWNFLVIDRYIEHDDNESGYFAVQRGSAPHPPEMVDASRSAHCPLLRAGFVDLDAHVMHNVVVPTRTGLSSLPFESYLVDLDSLVPVYLYLPIRFLVRALGMNERLG